MNFHSSLQLLELCRSMEIRPRIVFASSCAVFGGEVSSVINDDTAPNPRSSYGTQKAMVELLMNDYSRKGFVDARILRLPTIAVRSGKPNAAASSFVSAIIRDPLQGNSVNCPVSRDTELWIQSPGSVVRNFIHAASLEEKVIKENRIINLPALTVTVREMIDSLEALGPPGITDRISFEPDEFIQGIVLTWPAHFQTRLADRLGFIRDGSANEIVGAYINEQP
jgi:nucleoside-diphosphate-sugar epimerase